MAEDFKDFGNPHNQTRADLRDRLNAARVLLSDLKMEIEKSKRRKTLDEIASFNGSPYAFDMDSQSEEYV